jgi:hypothetical protein
MAEPGVARSNGSATLLHVEKIHAGQQIHFRAGHVLEPRPTKLAISRSNRPLMSRLLEWN